MSHAMSLQELMVNELHDLYGAEKQLTKALPKLAKVAASDELRNLITTHLEETRNHVDRLDRVFEMMEEKPKTKRCAGIAGIIEESDELARDHADGPVLDAGIIGGAQRAEHYEIAAYGTVIAWAKTLGRDDVADVLNDTLTEEKAANAKLNALATGRVNLEATRGHGRADADTDEADIRDHTGGRRSASMKLHLSKH